MLEGNMSYLLNNEIVVMSLSVDQNNFKNSYVCMSIFHFLTGKGNIS